jgi:hypothetical protein
MLTTKRIPKSLFTVTRLQGLAPLAMGLGRRRFLFGATVQSISIAAVSDDMNVGVCPC